MIPYEKFTDHAKEALQAAQDVLLEAKQVQLDSEHVLYGLLKLENSLAMEVLGAKDGAVTIKVARKAGGE